VSPYLKLIVTILSRTNCDRDNFGWKLVMYLKWVNSERGIEW